MIRKNDVIKKKELGTEDILVRRETENLLYNE